MSTVTRCARISNWWSLLAFGPSSCLSAPAAGLWDDFRDSLSEDHLERNPRDPEMAIELALIDIRWAFIAWDYGILDVQDDALCGGGGGSLECVSIEQRKLLYSIHTNFSKIEFNHEIKHAESGIQNQLTWYFQTLGIILINKQPYEG